MAANKAFLTNRVGDIGMFIGIMILYFHVGSFNIKEIISGVSDMNSGLLTLAGLLVFMGNDFNNDVIIYSSGRQARIGPVVIRNTVFYMLDRKTKMLVPNEQLKQLTIEKTLPKNGGAPYLPKGCDPNFVGTKEVPIEPPPMQVEVVSKPTSRKKP